MPNFIALARVNAVLVAERRRKTSAVNTLDTSPHDTPVHVADAITTTTKSILERASKLKFKSNSKPKQTRTAPTKTRISRGGEESPTPLATPKPKVARKLMYLIG